MPKPKPVVTSTVCSECGLAWDDHGESPTLADCVRLLLARPVVSPTIVLPYTINTPWYPQTYEITCGTVSAHATNTTASLN
jgi:hypothetical protein